MTTVLKYIIGVDKKPIVFSREIQHSDLGHVAISAGFSIINYDSNHRKFKVKCYGESSSLHIISNPTIDEKIIESFLNG
jgi:hypothetical protein